MTRRSFQKEDWLDLGLRELSVKGPDALKLEAICKTAGLTRGSFYHHFPDHSAFLVGLAERWRHLFTDTILEELDLGGDMDAASERLTDLALQIDYRQELGIREIARRNADVARVVKDTDIARLGLLCQLYAQRHGLDPDEAMRFATLEYAAYCGLILLDPDMPRDHQRALVETYDTAVHTYFRKRSK